MEKQWFQRDYRRIFMDMHLDDALEEEYLSKLDVVDFVKTLKEANVNNVVVKAKSHVGLHYWPSKYGRMHEGLKRRGLDYLGEMIKECSKEDISVTTYFSQIYDNYAYEQHPAWRVVNKSGKTSRTDGGRYGHVCPNNKEYRVYTREILQELATNYAFVGIFLDMPFWTDICYCHACRERFQLETGHDIPHEIDWENPVWVDFARRRQDWLNEFAQASTHALKEINPAITIEHNFAAIGVEWVYGDKEALVDTCDYAGGDYYGGYLEQTFFCKYYNNVTPTKPFVYITSRCDPNLYAHTVSRCKEDLHIHAVNALMHNGAFSVCDAMNPDGTITHEVYKDAIGPVYRDTAQYEQYVSGHMQSDVAVWFNTNLKVNENFIQSPFAVARVLQEHNVLFDVVGSRNIRDLKVPVLCMNDVYEVTDEEVADLTNYVTNGGNLFITGRLGNEKLAELLEVEVLGESEYDYTYLNPTEMGVPFFEGFNHSSPYPMKHKAYECKLKAEAEVLATLTYPYSKPGAKRFSAIHSDPPGIHTSLPGVIQKQVGKGKIMWVVMPLELTPAHYCKRTVYHLIKSLCKEPVLTSNAPAFVELTKWEKEGKEYIGVVNQQTIYPVYPITGIEIVLPTVYKEVKLLTAPQAPLEVVYEADKTIIRLADLTLFHMLELTK